MDIAVNGLVKKFGSFTALDHLDLAVESGSVHGFLGPNGSGKSTTIRTLLGLYRRESGQVTVLGQDPATSADTINRKVAYVPGDVALWPNLTGMQCLDALASMRGARDAARESLLIERFALDPSKRVRTYSRGNRQKVALIAALSAPVKLLLLDEPTSGLDPLMEQAFREPLRKHKDLNRRCSYPATSSARSKACARMSRSFVRAAQSNPDLWHRCATWPPARSALAAPNRSSPRFSFPSPRLAHHPRARATTSSSKQTIPTFRTAWRWQ